MPDSIVIYRTRSDQPIVPPMPSGAHVTYSALPPVGEPNRVVQVTPRLS